MEKIIILLFICFYQLSSYAQIAIIENNNLEDFALKGPVKAVYERSSHAKKVKGDILKSSKGWPYGWENDKEFYFDSLGKLMLKKDVFDSISRQNYVIKYDSKNRIAEVNCLHKISFYFYDSLNRIVSSKELNKQVEIVSNRNEKYIEGSTTLINYFYDSENLLIRKEEFKNNSISAIETFKYDKLNNLILNEYKKGAYIETHKYRYNKNNQLIKYQWTDNVEGLAEISTFKYTNGSKTLERWVDYEEGEENGYIEDKFENGLIVESIEVDAEGAVTSKEFCKYKLDVNGNWIKKIFEINGEYYIIERSIEYYE